MLLSPAENGDERSLFMSDTGSSATVSSSWAPAWVKFTGNQEQHSDDGNRGLNSFGDAIFINGLANFQAGRFSFTDLFT